MRDFTMRPDRQHESEYTKPPSLIKEQQAHLDAIATEGTLRLMQRDAHNENAEDYQEGRQQQEPILDRWMQRGAEFADDSREGD